VDWSTLVKEYIAAREAGDTACWIRGDLALKAGKPNQRRLAEEASEPIQTLRAYAYVASRYKESVRAYTLSFSHHRVVAYQKDRLKWLAAAAEQKWSQHKLEEELRTALAARARAQQEELPTARNGWAFLGSLASLVEEVHITSVSGHTQCPNCDFEFVFVEPDTGLEYKTDTFLRAKHLMQGVINDG
jgi:hypothetical protein